MSANLKRGCGILLIASVVLLSILALLPDADVDHDAGYTASELSIRETVDGSVTSTSYVNPDGLIADAIDMGYGDLTLADGTLLGNEGLPVFTRQGADTFVMELRYPVFLQPDPAALAGQELMLVLRDLVAYNVENRVDNYDENGFGGSRWDMTNETDLPGVYTVSFTVPAASERGIRTATGQDAASGVTVDALRATPAATKLVVTTPNDPPAGTEPADHVTPYSTDEFVLCTDTGELLKLERAEGEPVDETGGAYRYTAYFDAVPEDAASVTLTVLRGGETFATLPLPLSETTE